MNLDWKTVRVFISSTFRDMQAERDHLVRFVFPKLRQELLQQRIHLVDMDLRWGVTSEQDALSVCREVVDECRPRFLCMLGGRYGWVPPGKTRSITADEVHYGVLDRDLKSRGFAFFYFRAPATTAAMVELTQGEFIEPAGSSGAQALAELKSAITDAGLNPYIYPAQWDDQSRRLIGLKEFGDRVYTDLKQSIGQEFGEAEVEQSDEFTEERAAMEAFIEERVQRFVLGSREPVRNELRQHAESKGGNGYLCLTGAPGSGKSALLGKFSQDYRELHPHDLVIPHFVGATPGSTDVRRTLRRLCHELTKGAGLKFEIPEDLEKLRVAFAETLLQASTTNRVVIIMDGINQLDQNTELSGCSWLPQMLPDNARLILSALNGPVLEALRQRRQPPLLVALHPLDNADRKAIICEFLHRYRKSMTEAQSAALLTKADAGTPLYLLAALEELRTLGTHEEITQRIAELPPDTKALFIWILKRLEQDDGFRDADGQKIGQTLVAGFVSLLGVSRHGLSQHELDQLLSPGDPQGNVAALSQLLRPYLMQRGELLDFYHGQFREAAATAYLPSESQRLAAHDQLATFFREKADPDGKQSWRGESPRPFLEVVHHLAAAQRPKDCCSILCDLKFVEARCRINQVFELLADYRLASGCPPDAQSSTIFELFHTACLQEAANLATMIQLSLPIPVDRFVRQQIRNRIFCNSLGEVDLLRDGGSEWSETIIHRRPARPSAFMLSVPADPGNTILRDLAAVRFTPDGQFLVAAVGRSRVPIIDPTTGDVVHWLACVGRATAIDFSIDGSILVLGGDMGAHSGCGFVQLFDLNQCTSIAIQEFDNPVYRLAVSAANCVLTGCAQIVRILEIPSLRELRQWRPFDKGLAFSIAVNRSRTLVALGEYHNLKEPARIIVSDACTLEVKTEINGPKYGISSLAFSDIEGILASGSIHLNNGVVSWQWKLPGSPFDAMLLSPDERAQAYEAIRTSGRREHLAKGRVISTLETQDTVGGVCFYPNSSWLVSVEGTHNRTSDAINVFNIFGSRPSNVGKICGHSAFPIGVDVDPKNRFVATVHAKGEVVVWPAEAMKKAPAEPPPAQLSEPSADSKCSRILSVEQNNHGFIHVLETSEDRELQPTTGIPSLAAAISPDGQHIIRFYWLVEPVNPYLGGDPEQDAPSKQWWHEFQNSTPVCCYIEQFPNRSSADDVSHWLPKSHRVVKLSPPHIRRWQLAPRVQARSIVFSPLGTYGAALIKSDKDDSEVLLFSLCSDDAIRIEASREFLITDISFAPTGSLLLIGSTNNELVVRHIDPQRPENACTAHAVYGFGPCDQVSCGPMSLRPMLFALARNNNLVEIYSGDDRQKGDSTRVSCINRFDVPQGVFSMCLADKGRILVLSDGYPSLRFYDALTFKLMGWRPLQQACFNVFSERDGTLLTVVGRMPELQGVHYSVMEMTHY